MNRTKTTQVRCFVPPQVLKDFAGVRGHVKNAIQASPQSVSLSEVMEQIRIFQRGAK